MREAATETAAQGNLLPKSGREDKENLTVVLVQNLNSVATSQTRGRIWTNLVSMPMDKVGRSRETIWKQHRNRNARDRDTRMQGTGVVCDVIYISGKGKGTTIK